MLTSDAMRKDRRDVSDRMANPLEGSQIYLFDFSVYHFYEIFHLL